MTPETTQADGKFTYWYSDDYSVAYSRNNQTGEVRVDSNRFEYGMRHEYAKFPTIESKTDTPKGKVKKKTYAEIMKSIKHS